MLRNVFLILSLFATQLLVSTDVSAKVKFTQSHLQTDLKITHPVKTADLLALGSEQLIIIGEDKQEQAVLAIYRLLADELGYVEISRIVIPDSFLAYDLLKTQLRQKIVFQTNNALFEYVPEENKFASFAETQSIYLQPEAQFLAAKDFIKDVNGDELEDIVIADFTGVHILLQDNHGGFLEQTIPVRPKMQNRRDSATFTETPLFFADLNIDRKKDLIVVRDAGLRIFHQNGNGSFESNAHDLRLPIDVNALNWWEIRGSDGEQLDQSELSHRAMDKIEDINNDQIADLLVRFSQTDGLLDRQNTYEIYLGKVVDGELTYSQTPDSVIKTEGGVAGMDIVDVDGDKKSEIMLANLDIGVSQIIGALLSGSIDQDIYIFKMDENDNFGKKPNVDKEVALNFSLSSGKSGDPVVKLADFDGDGLKDLMFSSGSRTLKVYQGTSKKRLFKRRSVKHKVLLPKDGDLLDTTDLNNDGKEDVIIRYGRQDKEELNSKLVLLFAS